MNEEPVVARGSDGGVGWELRMLESQFPPRLGRPSIALRRGQGSVVAPLHVLDDGVEHRLIGGLLISDIPTRMLVAEVVCSSTARVNVIYEDGDESEVPMVDATIAGRAVRFAVGPLRANPVCLISEQKDGARVTFVLPTSTDRAVARSVDAPSIIDR